MVGRVTMRDVAQAVGMSPMTVSRALRSDETVSRDTREKVQTAARDLGYVYDTTAQAFRSKRSGFVAVALPSINNATFADTFRTLSEGLVGMGIQPLLAATNYRLEREEALVRQLLTRNPEALILTGGTHTSETRALLRAQPIPIVEMWDLPPEPLGHVVGFSNGAAMERIVRHLAETGRRKLAFVGASEGADLRGASRRAGALAAARALGLPEMAVIDAGEAPVSMRHGAGAIEVLGREVRAYDALVCVSDPVAFGCLSACRRLGVSVPDDLAITGFGGFEVGQVSHPRITTAHVDARRIGSEVVDILRHLGGTGHDGPPRVIDVGSELRVGGTS